MISPNPLYLRIMRWPWQGRAALILLITLVAMWLVAQGIWHGLETSAAWMMPPPERPNGCADILQEIHHPAYSLCVWLVEQRVMVWQRFGMLLTAYGGLLIALFAHSVIGAPLAYSYLGRLALCLLVLAMLAQFWGVTICITGLLREIALPVILLTLTVITIYRLLKDQVYIGDWVVLGMFMIQGILFHLYFEEWWRVFGD